MSSTRDWLLAHLHAPLTLEDIARHANMSTRNFSRRFFAETGVSPMKWLQTARIDHARELLESTDLTVEQVARRSGLGTVANFRRIFTRQVSVLPATTGNFIGRCLLQRASDQRANVSCKNLSVSSATESASSSSAK